MAPIYVARGLADGRHRELPAGEERRRLIAAVPTGPAGPGAVQRFALRVAGRGQRPAVARRPAALAPRAYGPLAI
jgi:hypothetical protein